MDPLTDQRINAPTRQHPNTSLVLFDFDGTITSRDTLIEFARFYHGRNRFFSGMIRLSPMLVLLVLKVLPNWKVKQYFLTHFFKGESLTRFNVQCTEFTEQVLPSLIRPAAMEAIERYRASGIPVAVVTASAENWVKPWCDHHDLICLATRLEVKDGMLTGNLAGRNCYGDEKVCRIKEHFNLSDYTDIIAYGDSRGDREMLALAHQAHFKPFRD